MKVKLRYLIALAMETCVQTMLQTQDCLKVALITCTPRTETRHSHPAKEDDRVEQLEEGPKEHG